MALRIAGLMDITEVGRGGFGTVYRAHDERFVRDVAVKVIRGSAKDPDIKARFEREIRALGNLSGHPNIVAVYDSGVTEDGDFYLVMEYLPGGTLGDRMRASSPPSVEELAGWGASLAGALETAHRAGIIHRDVKPENILMSAYGVPKLVDFGIARMRSAFETRSGFMSATLAHAAPEVIAGSPVTPAADIYALASVLHTLASGHAPFERRGEESLAPLLARIALEDPPDLRLRGVDDEFASVLEKGLAKDPAARFSSAAEMAAALSAIAGSTATAPVILGPMLEPAPVAPAPAAPTQRLANETVDVPIRRSAQVAAAPEETAPRRRKRLVLVALACAFVIAVPAGAYAVHRLGAAGETTVTPPTSQASDVPTPGPETGAPTQAPKEPETEEPTEPEPTAEVPKQSERTPEPTATAAAPKPTQTTKTQPTKTQPPAKATGSPPTITGASTTTDERRTVSVSFTTTGSGVTVRKVSGPSWLSVSGSKVTGQVPYDAATGRSSATVTVKLEARNQHGSATANVRITVRDTHFAFPNYVGKYGNGDGGLPRIDSIVSPRNYGCQANDRTTGTIYSTSPKSGSILAYGQRVSFWYVNPDAPDGQCSAIAG